MPGTLLISLDCEGKWGMADDARVVSDQVLTHRSLVSTYERLLETLEKNELSATFAVVGLFVAGPDEATSHVSRALGDPLRTHWLKHARQALAQGSNDGWFLEELPNMLDRSGRHELASHGYSHLPFTIQGFTREHALEELTLMRDLVDRRSWSISSMVFPRNGIAHTSLLPEFGIDRYRNSPENDSFIARVRSLLSEYNVCASAEGLPIVAERVAGGRFLNWRRGARRMVPAQLTLSRWQQILEKASAGGRCAHMWFHPHNLITGYKQWDLVERVLGAAGKYVQDGRLVSRTFSNSGSET